AAVLLGTAAGLCCVTIKHMFRENGEPTIAGGALGALLKSFIKGNNLLRDILVDLGSETIGEYMRPVTGKNLKNFKVLASTIVRNEAVNRLCVNWISGQNLKETMSNTTT